jgi:hypothetical protein
MMKLINILKEITENNPNSIILPINIYYIGDSTSELRDIGLDEGTVTEPKLMDVLWSEYQMMKAYTQTIQSGGDKTTNKMQDAGFNINPKSDADEMFFGGRLQEIIDEIELYVSEGTPITNYGDDMWEDEEGNNFSFSKQEADKYQYNLVDDDEFKQFTETVKQALG